MQTNLIYLNGGEEYHSGKKTHLLPWPFRDIYPYLIHQFWGEEGTGVKVGKTRYTVSGEVSSICDDWNDNVWLEPVERFPAQMGMNIS